MCSVCQDPLPDVCFSKGTDHFCKLQCLRAFQSKLAAQKAQEDKEDAAKRAKNQRSVVDSSGGGGCH
jgi:hypothetical protein